jgi:hypothetical protein
MPILSNATEQPVQIYTVPVPLRYQGTLLSTGTGICHRPFNYYDFSIGFTRHSLQLAENRSETIDSLP